MPDKSERLRALHVPGQPLILWNIWDAGSARVVADAGAAALATGSASLAGALGDEDGQSLPLDLLLTMVTRIVAVSDLPLSVDFESGYAEASEDVARNAMRLAETGAAGLNFEDGIPPENGIRSLDQHLPRLAALRKAVPGMFVNARTDLFLLADSAEHAGLLPEAVARARAYARAGADGFFAPGLIDPGLIRSLCNESPLPVNIMKSPAAPGLADLAALGVARISFGPFPWRGAMQHVAQVFRAETA